MEKATRTTTSFPSSDEFCGLLITLQTSQERQKFDPGVDPNHATLK